MHRLRTATLPVVALLAVGALVLGACSSDDSASSKKTTTTEKSAKGSTTTAKGTTSSTVPAAEYDQIFGSAESQLAGAGGDVCAVYAVFSTLSSVPPPTDKARIKRYVEVNSQLLAAIAATAPADQAAAAAAISKAATDVKAEGESTGYSDAFMNGPKAFESKEFQTAITTFQSQASSQCASTTTTAP